MSDFTLGYITDPSPLQADANGKITIKVQPTAGNPSAHVGDDSLYGFHITFPVGTGEGDLTTPENVHGIGLKASDPKATAAVGLDKDTHTATVSVSSPFPKKGLTISIKDIRVGSPGEFKLTTSYTRPHETDRRVLDTPRPFAKSSGAFYFSNLKADQPQVESGKEGRLTWNASDHMDSYTVDWAGTSSAGGSRTLDAKAVAWTTPKLDDPATTFCLTATATLHGAVVRHSLWVTVFGRRGMARTGHLQALGTVRITDPRPQYVFDDVALTTHQVNRASAGVFEDQTLPAEGKPLSEIFPLSCLTPSDGALLIRVTGDPFETPLQLTARYPSESADSGLTKEWGITAGTSLTLPLPTGTALEFTEPAYMGGERRLTVHWAAQGGHQPLALAHTRTTGRTS
ncbi:hypothetical protein [Streptomyces tsukubensis]|uniref:Uncharacterized protein n=1 Tax=Streptomyces tsukubensis TaxID=83656 RepID=A0A1V4A5Y3_9ACTN|nr:hypothetical protein [Streptomyces tsukubensis]OON76202.1 hypothetical protein B1H18_21510 [Streptomyces tsukubensis]QFR93725.1 hypothetical protein GBW32_12325 [Streptomyces tsukubensis]